MLRDYGIIGIFLVLATVFPLLAFVISSIVRPHRPNLVKGSPYESGMPVVGDAWVQFNIRYYLYALIFIVFDVEAIFLFPWAMRIRELGLTGFIDVLIFVGILLIGLAYAWRKRALEWK